MVSTLDSGAQVSALETLVDLGPRIWLGELRRDYLIDGTLARFIDEAPPPTRRSWSAQLPSDDATRCWIHVDLHAAHRL
jgi:hypothetical protein